MSRTDRPDRPHAPERDSDDLRALFQDQPGETASGEECPSPDTLWASARGELDADENRRVILHTGRCPSCAEDWRLARHLGRRLAGEAVGDEGETPGERSRLRAPSPRWLRAAAAAVVAVLGAGVLLWQQSPEEPVFRDGPQETTEPSAAIRSLTPEDRPLSHDEPTLRWAGPEGAVYTLVVTTSKARILVHEQRLTETEYRLPRSVVAKLEPGTSLLWHVKAVLPDGSRVRSLTSKVEIQ